MVQDKVCSLQFFKSTLATKCDEVCYLIKFFLGRPDTELIIIFEGLEPMTPVVRLFNGSPATFLKFSEVPPNISIVWNGLYILLVRVSIKSKYLDYYSETSLSRSKALLIIILDHKLGIVVNYGNQMLCASENCETVGEDFKSQGQILRFALLIYVVAYVLAIQYGHYEVFIRGARLTIRSIKFFKHLNLSGSLSKFHGSIDSHHTRLDPSL